MASRWCAEHVQFRHTKDEIMTHLMIEYQLLRFEWKWIAGGVLATYLHSVFTNIAYHIQSKLSIEQRFPLYDLGYEILPELTESQGWITEVLVFGGVFAPMMTLALSILVVHQSKARPPKYLVLIVKRVLLVISLAQVLRVVSFLGEIPPGAGNPHVPVLTDCVVPNPEFEPPTNVSDYFLRMDALTGCGDLMFSSHTIYTLTFILAMVKYWGPSRLLTVYGVVMQLVIAVLIIMAKKHYTLDVFTALYVVPLLWFILEAYHMDINHKDVGITQATMVSMYGIDISPDVPPETKGSTEEEEEEEEEAQRQYRRLEEQGTLAPLAPDDIPVDVSVEEEKS